MRQGKRAATVRRRPPGIVLGVAGVVLALGLGLGLFACSGDDPSDQPEGAVPTETGRSSATPDGADTAPRLSGAALATKDLQVTACPPGTGEVTATGSVVNRSKKAADYLVSVDWLAEDGAVLASAWTALDTVQGRPGKNRVAWEVEADLGEEQAASCTTRLLKGGR